MASKLIGQFYRMNIRAAQSLVLKETISQTHLEIQFGLVPTKYGWIWCICTVCSFKPTSDITKKKKKTILA